MDDICRAECARMVASISGLCAKSRDGSAVVDVKSAILKVGSVPRNELPSV